MILRRPIALTVPFFLCLLAVWTLQPAWGADNQPAPQLSAAMRSAHFAEPLVATGPTTVVEDAALSRALSLYAQRQSPEDFSALTAFLADQPKSGWSSALYTNLGLSYLHYGYFSRALDAWKAAWLAGKDATDLDARALVDRAAGELAQLYASLGNIEKLEALSAEIGNRPVTGAALEQLETARRILTLSKTDPRHLYNCGPTALRSLILAAGGSESQVSFLPWHKVGPNGASLAELGQLAQKAKFGYRIVSRKPGQPVPLPAVVHWKAGHYGAIVETKNGRYHLADAISGKHDLWVTQAALDAEASGYFITSAELPLEGGWRAVEGKEAASIWGKGPTLGTKAGDAGDPRAKAPEIVRPPPPSPADNPGKPDPDCGMCVADIKEAAVSVTISDTPVGYSPAVGPSVRVIISYNQREDSQPAVFGYFNIGPKWTLNWLSYVTDDPAIPGGTVSRVQGGGGAVFYTGYSGTTGRFAAQTDDSSILVRVSGTPIRYERRRGDGSKEIYQDSDGSSAYPRRIFLSAVVDPQGNTVTLTYDGQQRLVSLTDALSRQTTLSYGLPSFPLLITQITDPFGRSAKFTYNAAKRLASITDVIGITSSVTYDANAYVDSLTTPYGTTSFAYTAPGTSMPPRFVEITDPLGYHEREEWLEPAPVPSSEASPDVPVGMPISLTNAYLEYRDSFHWDKNSYIVAGCTPSGGCDYSKARNTHFHHMPSTSIKATSIESVKYPLENRIWYTYPGQTLSPPSIYGGTSNKPNAVGRVLDDGTTQITQYSYDTGDYFNLLMTSDPVGRTTQFTYALNNIDLQAVNQLTSADTFTPVAQYTYNGRHQPVAYTNASGETTLFGYNAVGQVTSIIDPLDQKTSYHYDSWGNLTSITNANGVTAATYTYDSYARVRTYTDSEGWMVTYDYDAADRVTKVTYPDGTARRYTYDKLDMASMEDREGRVWRYVHDANRRLTHITNPQGQLTVRGYNGTGQLTSLTDPGGNVTTWTYDVQGRLLTKEYADTSTVTYAYETTTSRLHSVTDALGQVKEYGYTHDDRIASITYASTVNPTPNVSFAYDAYYPRRTTMTDGAGDTAYSYVDPFAPGAMALKEECFVPTGGTTCSSQIGYAYDALSRLASRTVDGAGAETFEYDSLGRLVTHASDLGEFALAYLGQTGQMTERRLVTGATDLKTNFDYLTNTDDRRLAEISNIGLTSSNYSTFQFATTPENYITAITETADIATVYPSPAAQTASYNNLNQMTNLSGQALSYDANGNLLSDGLRTYAWDGENRLIEIAYPAQPGKKTEFTYDGLGRRVVIIRTPAGGGSSVTTNYVWCGTKICQSRGASNDVEREYHEEGELVSGTPDEHLYYGIDQLGSVQRAFSSVSGAPAFGYDPYGNPLQATAALTDFGYAGMLTEADSGLYLAMFRAYDPVAGRWLSRDPMGEASDLAANLYAYVRGNPVNNIDPHGLYTIQVGMGGSINIGPVSIPIGYGLAIDHHGNVGVYEYAGAGASAGASAEAGASAQVSNAETICDLGGWFNNFSGHAGSGAGGSVDVFNGESAHGPVTGGGVTLGAAAGASVSVGRTYTNVIPVLDLW